MLVIVLMISSALFLGTTIFLGRRVATAMNRATDAEQSRDRLQNESKKIKERLSKAEKKIKSSGSSTAKDDRKQRELQGAVDDLRKQLADARKAQRKAEKRADSADEARRSTRRRAEDSEEKSDQLRDRLQEKNVEELARADEIASLPTKEEQAREMAARERSARERESDREVRRDSRWQGEVDKLRDDIKYARNEARNEARQLQRDLATSRRKAEHQRRAYLITQRQLELAQDLLEVMETEAGTTANAVLLEKSPRAKKRHEIRQNRAKARAEAEMPPQLDGPVVKIPDPPVPTTEIPEIVQPVEAGEDASLHAAKAEGEGEAEDSKAPSAENRTEEAEEVGEAGEVAEEPSSDEGRCATDDEGENIQNLEPTDETAISEARDSGAGGVSPTVRRRRRPAAHAERVEG